MSIVYHDTWEMSEKGRKDAERHRQKIDKAIRDNVKNVIADHSIITSKGDKKVRITVKGLKDYKFRYGFPKEGSAGAGQGEGEEGDEIGRSPGGSGGQPGQPGNRPGFDYMDTEVDLDYIIKIMFDDLGLPWIEEKTKAQQLVPKGWKFEAVAKKGIISRIHKKKTLFEAIKRTQVICGEICKICNVSYETALLALNNAKGDAKEAVRLLNEKCTLSENSTSGNVFIDDDDLRFKQIDVDYEYHSKAVVIAMMDVSGSMTMDKKYLARSMLFWMVQFLRKVYESVEIRFIVHTTEAREVDEQTFFYKGESGGTMCHTAIDKATYMIDTEYPINEYNVYCVFISDGEDFDTDTTCSSVKKLLSKKINMFAYTEINPMEENNAHAGLYFPSNTLLREFKKRWKFLSYRVEGSDFYRNPEEHFLITQIKKKEHVYESLKWFLFQKRDKV